MTSSAPKTPASGLPPVAHRRAARTAQAEGAGQPGSLHPPVGEPGLSSPQPGERQAAGIPSPDTGAQDPPLRGTAPVRGRAGPRTFTLALPPGLALLSLNDRGHWAARYRRSEALKKAAWALALSQRIPRLERVSVTVEYQPRDLRRRDGDNIAASAKALIDGLRVAGVLPEDDSRHVTEVTCRIGSLYPKGRLVLTLTEVPPEKPRGAA